ncbi:MAG: hypothetical protein J0I48_17840 [Devosia sp.]|uniref:MotE family protein n=1 Tax=Devosia sp. 66-22 TaxID=1895753 RepID=UPI000A631218|nr:hypothetical protein [Devosia sp. 66-22]MBN9348032.1 hypothetical protein [Devosia sp.]
MRSYASLAISRFHLVPLVLRVVVTGQAAIAKRLSLAVSFTLFLTCAWWSTGSFAQSAGKEAVGDPTIRDATPTIGLQVGDARSEDEEPDTDVTMEDLAPVLQDVNAVAAMGTPLAGEFSENACAVDGASLEMPTGPSREELSDTECASGEVEQVDPLEVAQPAWSQLDQTPPTTEELLSLRLSERREQLAKWEEEAEMQRALLEAAEQRMQAAAQKLAEMQEQVGAGVEASATAKKARLEASAATFETMRPAEAAEILEAIPHGTVVEILAEIEPKKLSAILGKMTPSIAGDLTVHLSGLPLRTP